MKNLQDVLELAIFLFIFWLVYYYIWQQDVKGKFYIAIPNKYKINMWVYVGLIILNAIVWYIFYTPYNINVDLFMYNGILPWY